MNKYFTLAALGVLFFSCQQSPKFTVEAEIEGLKDGKVYLKLSNAGMTVPIDSTTSAGGKFTFKGTVEVPDLYYLVGEDRVSIPLMLENSPIVIAGNVSDLKSISITGSKTQDEYHDLELKIQDLGKQFDALYSQYKEAMNNKDSLTSALLESRLDSLDREQTGFYKSFVTENGASFVAPVILQKFQYGMEADELQSYLVKFSPEVMKGQSAKLLADRVAVLEKVAVGRIAPDFTLNDSIGNPVKLSEIYSQHELTLVDFWASWCGPCRQENPNVVSTWKDYSSKGFTVLGVSCDSDRDRWLKAIAQDQLTWYHVSDLKGWGNEAAKLYGINSIPSSFLLDKSGTIIAKNLRGANLRGKIAEILK